MTTTLSLRSRYDELLAERPHLRIRDAARLLQVGEAELLALECGRTATRLQVNDWHGFIRGLRDLGRVMVLTRNEFCVHEKTGCYEKIPGKGDHVGLVTGKDIDLRLFYGRWSSAFAVVGTDARGNPLRSFQFFDLAGEAIHKVYLRNEEGLPLFQEIVARHRSEDQSEEQLTREPAQSSGGREHFANNEELETFLGEWAGLEDTHDFFGMLKRHDISRRGAIASADGRFTKPMDAEAAVRLLQGASASGTPIMVFTGNPGAIQIHTGPIQRTARGNGWMNVLDEGFNLHLKESGIASSWIVEKPTRDGIVTSLELLDASGETIVQFFGERKPGKPEREDWRSLIRAL
jgi:putative hemin transport protein